MMQVGPVRNPTSGADPEAPLVPGKPNTSAVQPSGPITALPAETVQSVAVYGA